jgi:hypothetical protein
VEKTYHRHGSGGFLFEEKFNPYFNCLEVFPTEFNPKSKTAYRPLVFKPQYASLGDTTAFTFDSKLKRWVPHDYLSRQ